MSGNAGQSFPNLASAVVDKAGKITHPWRALLAALWARTGGSAGVDSATIQALAEAAQSAAEAAAASAATAQTAATAAQTAAQGAFNTALFGIAGDSADRRVPLDPILASLLVSSPYP